MDFVEEHYFSILITFNFPYFKCPNTQTLPSEKFSQVHKLSGKITKYKKTQDLGRDRDEG
jgi:hypothetical protein